MLSEEKEFYEKQGFTTDQIQEISLGRKSKVETACYENTDYLAIQMHQIRLGLESHLDVSHYLNPEFDWFQMEEIRLGLQDRVDVILYAKPSIPYDKMRQVRKALRDAVDLRNFEQLSANVIKQIRYAKKNRVDITRYVEEGYDAEQLQEIRLALRHGVALDPYLSKDYRGVSLAEIRLGLEHHIDVFRYASTDYSWRQMREIRLGLEMHLPIDLYESPFYSWEQMREIRLGLEAGVNVTNYRRLRFPAEEMRRQRLALLEEQDSKESVERLINEAEYDITINNGNMAAFFTLRKEVTELTQKVIMDLLTNHGIVKGIHKNGIQELVNSPKVGKPVMVAQGLLPRRGEDGYYEYYFDIENKKKPKLMEDGSVDYQDVAWFEMVRKEQRLAFYHPAKEGEEGYNVFGDVLEARKGAELPVLVGSGFQLLKDGQTYIAAGDGKVSLEGNCLTVESYIEVEDVTTATGNLIFDGTIHIKGDVGTGAIVKASADIVIDGNVNAATIVAGGNILLKKGMNAENYGTIQAKGNIVSKFFEQTKVYAEGDIEVVRCLNSQLEAGNVIRSRSVILGGKAIASAGFELRDVGNKAHQPTKLVIQMHPKNNMQYHQILNKEQDVKRELEILSNSKKEMEEHLSSEECRGNELYVKLEAAIYTKETQLQKVLELKEKLEKIVAKVCSAKIEISGTAYSGTSVNLNGHKWNGTGQTHIVLRQSNDGLEIIK